MLRRYLIFGFVYVLLSIPIGYVMVNSVNQTPWLVAFFAYGALGGLVGSRYIFFGWEQISAAKMLGWLVLNVAVVLMITVGYLVITRQL